MAVHQEPVFGDVPTQRDQVSTSKNNGRATKAQRNGNGHATHFGLPGDEYLKFSISHLDTSRREPTFKLKVATNLPNYRQNAYPSVERSYGEFELLYNVLAYANPECIVPALPLGVSSQPGNEESERRLRHAMQQWLNRIAARPVLRHDEELRSFIETDFTFIPALKPRKRTNSFRLKLSGDVSEDDKRLSEARAIANVLEGHMYDNSKTVMRLTKLRRLMATYNTELGTCAINFGTGEVHLPFSNGLRKFGKALHMIAEFQQLQAVNEAAILGDFFTYYAANIRVVQETLINRLRMISEHETAVKTASSKRRNIERLKSSTSIQSDRVDEAIDDMEYSRTFEETLGARVVHVTKNLHNELEMFELDRQRDFISTFREFARKQVMFERQQLLEWENLRPDVRAITERNTRVHMMSDEPLDARTVAECLSTYL